MSFRISRRWQRTVATWLTWVATAVAGLLVLVALVTPTPLNRVGPGAFLRIPLEGLLGAALILALPTRARRAVAVLLGVALGLLTIVKIVDLGFFAARDRPFNPILDWSLARAVVSLLSGSLGRTEAKAVIVAAAVLAAALPVIMALSVTRLARLTVRHRAGATRAVALLTVAWLGCAMLDARIVPGIPVAADSSATLAYDSVRRVRAGLRDRQVFAAQLAVDGFRNTPNDELLTALPGKDVVLAFVESYGRSAIENPTYATRVGAVLDAGTRRLAAAGFTAKSAFLTSPTVGGGSWLAHATLLSGLWVDNQQRYRDLVSSDRLTLSRAFQRTGWKTAAVMPGTSAAWPEQAFYGYDQTYDAQHLGYRGKPFSWISSMPDQYTLASFERLERAAPQHAPVLAEIDLTSSHEPWVPVPRLIDWTAVGDGTAFDAMATEGDSPQVVWRDPDRIRTAYRHTVEYTLNTLVSYVETHGDDRMVLVFLGDHQPAPLITGSGASRDVPVTIVARDRAVLDRISGWGWQDGLKPGPRAPVWRMDAFRDRFLTTFGSRPGPAAPGTRTPR